MSTASLCSSSLLLLGSLLLWGCTACSPSSPAATSAGDRAAAPPGDGEGADPTCGLPGGPRRGLLVAGSGANLALVRHIAERFVAHHPQIPVEVPPSIGTSGAVRAVLDGVVDIGLTSRRLKAAERSAGLLEIPLARVAVVVALAARRSEPAPEAIEPELLCAVLNGEERRWPDGRPIIPLLREPGDSSNEVLRAGLPCFAAALEQAYASRRWRICITDQEMELALAQTQGSIGFSDQGTLALGPARAWARALRLGTLAPGGAAVRAGSYPLTKDLGFITLGPPTGAAAAFIRFAGSPAARDLFGTGGYVPLSEAAPGGAWQPADLPGGGSSAADGAWAPLPALPGEE
ncbi:MAG: hypothetical protein FJ125_08240 [Deltaproteobacteria bacterium]|nr:hypothetical protein [Deltaproteobacteria bacterium]